MSTVAADLALGKRSGHFLDEYSRWLHGERIAMKFGIGVHALLTAVACEEDRSGYTGQIGFWDGELGRLIGVSQPTFRTLRNKAVVCGLLSYTPGTRGRRAAYSAIVPEQPNEKTIDA